MIDKIFPIINVFKNYNSRLFNNDLVAGLTVGVMLIPQGMAYAMLAGLPPIYGLYASTIPILIYAALGTSRQLAVGPVAMVALLVSNGVSKLAETGTAQFIEYAILLALLVGVIQFLMGLFRLGYLVNFLAHPVIAGFTSAAAIIIGFSQLKHIFGLSLPRAKVHETFINIIENISAINMPTMLIGLATIILLVVIKRYNRKIPGPLIVVVLSMLLVYFADLQSYGVRILKDVPSGFPLFEIPSLNSNAIVSLLPMAFTISFISFLESFAVAKAIQAKHKSYEVLPNKELMALGLANVFGSFFKAFPVTGGFSRTAVNDQAGAKTTIASVISALLIVFTLLFLTKYFYYLPTAVLAAIILTAVYGLIDFKEAKHLWQCNKREFLVFMATALITLFVNVEMGILAGVILSMGLLIHQVSNPHIAELGRVPQSTEFRNVDRFNNLEVFDNILIFRFDSRLFFANITVFKNYIEQKIKKNPKIKMIIVEATSVNSLDSSAITMLIDLIEDLNNKEISLYLANVKGPVRDTLSINKLLKTKENLFFLTTNDAVEFLTKKELNESYKPFILQTEHN